MHRCSRGRPKYSLLVHSRDVISLMKPAFVWLGFRGPDCNVIAEQGGGPDARPSWAGSGPRAGGCPTLGYLLTGRRTHLVTDLKPLAPPTECTVTEVSSALSRRSKKFAQKNSKKSILINRNLLFQPYIFAVRSLAVFTANFVTVRGALALRFRIV